MLATEVGGQPGSLNGVREGVCLGVSQEGWLRWFAHPSGQVQGTRTVPCFCSWLFRSGSWGFSSFCILFIICPNCPRTQKLLVPCSFFAFSSCIRPLSRCSTCLTSQPVSLPPKPLRPGTGAGGSSVNPTEVQTWVGGVHKENDIEKGSEG